MWWALLWAFLAVIFFILWLFSQIDLDGERTRASSLSAQVDSDKATINELETERDILRAYVELERTRADANYEAGKTAKKDLEAALFKLRMVRRAMDYDETPTAGGVMKAIHG